MNWMLDLFFAAIVLIFAFLGRKRGFIKTFFGLFGALLAFVLSLILSGPVSGFVHDTFVYPFLKERFLSAIAERIGSGGSLFDFSALPESVGEVLTPFGVSTEEIADRFAQITSQGSDGVEGVCQWLIKPLSQSLSSAATCFVLFVVLSLAIRVAVNALDLISKLPVLNFSNRFLGFFVGLLEGVLVVFVLSSVLVHITPVLQGYECNFFLNFNPEESIIIRFFSRFNVLKTIL